MPDASREAKNVTGDRILCQRALSVVAIQEGFPAEMRVNQAFTWIHQSFRHDFRIAFNSWNFGDLETSGEAREMAVRSARSSDIIIVATSCARPVPDFVKIWLEEIIGQQRDNRALLVALENDDHSVKSHTNTLSEQLQRVAGRWQAEFVCCEDLQQPMSRQFILRFINDRIHDTVAGIDLVTENNPTEAESTLNLKLQSMNQSQSNMTPAQIQEIRGYAYHLWLQADRPAGKEIDFWLQAEEQVRQAAADQLNQQSTAKTIPLSKPATKKSKEAR